MCSRYVTNFVWKKTHLFNGLLSATIRVSWYQKGKTNLDLLEQEIASGSGISWAICKSAPCPRRITTTQFYTGWMPFLPSNQQHQSTEARTKVQIKHYTHAWNSSQVYLPTDRIQSLWELYHFALCTLCSQCFHSISSASGKASSQSKDWYSSLHRNFYEQEILSTTNVSICKWRWSQKMVMESVCM